MSDDTQDTVRVGTRNPRHVRSLFLSGLALAGAAGLLAACSSTASSTPSNGSGTSSSSGTSSGSSNAVLSTRQISGVGTVLVDKSGKTVYSPDQESGGTIKCTASCLSVWIPVTSTSAKPATSGGLSGTVGTVKRPDNGQMQVTYNGKPLYTFQIDQAPGQDKGQNAHDSFGGTDFTWVTVTTSGTPSGSTSGGAPGY